MNLQMSKYKEAQEQQFLMHLINATVETPHTP